MKPFTVVFFGHRYIEENPFAVKERIEDKIRELLAEHEYIEFTVGKNGEFDLFAAQAVRRVNRELYETKCNLTLFLPYPTAEYTNNIEQLEKYYDNFEVLRNTHPKSAITERNKIMVDRADLVICYISQKSGGAYRAVEYARKQNKKIINLCT